MNSDDGFWFDPYICHVEVGGEVTWELASGRHNTAAMHPDTFGPQQRIPEGGEPWKSDIMHNDWETFTHTFDVPGIYDYLCTPHISAGMYGSVIVGWPDLDDQPGLEPVSEEYREIFQVDQHWEVFSAWIEYLNETVVELLEDADQSE